MQHGTRHHDGFHIDVLGAAVEGKQSWEVLQAFPRALVDFVAGHRGYGRYTDDTQMTIALARSLVDCGRLDAAHASNAYARAFEAGRGYGRTAKQILTDLKLGREHWRTVGRKYLPDGSFGNGGAMRVAPVGLAYRHASAAALREAVQGAIHCTHVHPEAVDGGVVMAAAVAWLSKQPPPWSIASPQPAARSQVLAGMFTELGAHAHTQEMRGRLELLEAMVSSLPAPPMLPLVPPAHPHDTPSLRRTWGAYLASPAWAAELHRARSVQGEWFQIRAVDAVAAALCAFSHHGLGPQPANAVVAAVHYGGDTDTVASMAGALVGAYHGRWVPTAWYARLENNHQLGRDGIVRLGECLAHLDVHD